MFRFSHDLTSRVRQVPWWKCELVKLYPSIMTTVGYRVEISCVRPQIPQLFKSNERTEDKDLEIFLDLYYFIYIYIRCSATLVWYFGMSCFYMCLMFQRKIESHPRVLSIDFDPPKICSNIPSAQAENRELRKKLVETLRKGGTWEMTSWQFKQFCACWR